MVKTSDAQRRAFKKWRDNNKVHIKEYNRLNYPRKKKYLREYSKNKRKEILEKILMLFPKKCMICGIEDIKVRYLLHKIDGVKHSTNDSYRMALKNPNDFVRVCNSCHLKIHWWIKYKERLDRICPHLPEQFPIT